MLWDSLPEDIILECSRDVYVMVDEIKAEDPTVGLDF